MKNLILALMFILFTFNAYSQTYDLVRSITTGGFLVEDTLSNDFTEDGTLIIEGNIIKRFSTVCKNNICKDFNYIDELLGLEPDGNSYAVLSGDSGVLSTLYILSISPNIMVMKRLDDKSVEIQEYKPR